MAVENVSAIDHEEFEDPPVEQKDFNCHMYWEFELKLLISKFVPTTLCSKNQEAVPTSLYLTL